MRPRRSQDDPNGRGRSSVGRAREWHSRGQRFDPARLHQSSSRSRHPNPARHGTGSRISGIGQNSADAGLAPADIDAVMPSAMAGRIAEEFIVNLGLRDLAFSATVHTGGASVISSIQAGCLAIAAGVARNVLVVAGRLGYSEQRVSTMLQCFRVIRLERQGPVIAFKGLIVASEPEQRVAAIEPDPRLARFQIEGAFERGDSLIVPLELQKRKPAMHKRFEIIGP